MPHEDIRKASKAFLAAAFNALERERVLPATHYHPFVRVGRDYYGDSIMSLHEFQSLEKLLETKYPNRFSEEPKRIHREFASSYNFSLLEATAARCSSRDDFSIDSEGVEKSLDELIAVLEAHDYAIACCRVVSHITSVTGEPVRIGDVLVVPEIHGIRSFERMVDRFIPGGSAVFNRDPPFAHNPPAAMLVISETAEDPSPYDVPPRLSGKLERFLLHARLLTGTTAQTFYEIVGATTLVSRMAPHLTASAGRLDSPVRRTLRLDGTEDERLVAIGRLIDEAQVTREGMAATSFDTAVRKFHLSFRGGDLYDQFVDLATALEAALVSSDKDTEGIGLRLRSRSAAILSSDIDPASTIFADVNKLYGLRSSLVHGGAIKRAKLFADVKAISTVPEKQADMFFNIGLGYALDRLRDLVRRAILARLCLAADPDPVWPLDARDAAVDQLLADDATRIEWRERWRRKLADLGAAEASEPQPMALDYFAQEDDH
jgi:hypothetical protein